MTLMVINRNSPEQSMAVPLNDFKPDVAGRNPSAGREPQDRKIDAQKIEDGTTITVPPYSMTLYIVP